MLNFIGLKDTYSEYDYSSETVPTLPCNYEISDDSLRNLILEAFTNLVSEEFSNIAGEPNEDFGVSIAAARVYERKGSNSFDAITDPRNNSYSSSHDDTIIQISLRLSARDSKEIIDKGKAIGDEARNAALKAREAELKSQIAALQADLDGVTANIDQGK